MIDVAGQTAVVLGLGQSGLAMARALSEGGAVVRVADTRDDPPMRAALGAELPQVRFTGGTFDRGLLDACRCSMASSAWALGTLR